MNKSHPRLISTVLLSLCLALLSLQVNAQATFDPTRFEAAIKAFEAEDKISMPAPGAIVLTGSSSIARWNKQAAAALAPLSVIPRGFGGSVMEDALYYIDRVALAYKPRAILIYEGDNDTNAHVPQDKIISQFEQIVAKVHAESPTTRIYALSVKPSIARQNVWGHAQKVSARLNEIAHADPLVYYIDVATPFLRADGSVMTDIFVEDGLHLNDKGNAIWGTAIKAGLMRIEGQFE